MIHEPSPSELFQQYLDVCNQALKANKERFPFKQILGAAQDAENARNIEVKIIDDAPDAAFVMKIDHDKIIGEDHEQCENCQCDSQWKITKTYLLDVISDPQAYIDNPAKIDWEWMYKSSS